MLPHLNCNAAVQYRFNIIFTLFSRQIMNGKKKYKKNKSFENIIVFFPTSSPHQIPFDFRNILYVNVK